MAVEVETKPTPQAFGSSGGKFHLARKISSVMPEHKTYVEPYAGGAAVYFYKEPAEKEVLNDMDKEIAFAYRFIRDMTSEQYEALKRKNWVISRSNFDKVKGMKPANDVDRFYKFYYLKKGSFKYGTTNVNVGKLGTTIGLDRLSRVQERLRGVAINSTDALAMIAKYDSPNTFFYLDPPYPSTSPIGGNAPNFTKDDLAKLVERLKHIRGKFMLSLDATSARNLPKWLNIKRVKVEEHNNTAYDGWRTRAEILATNFKISKPRRFKPRRRLRYREPTKCVTCIR